MRGRTITIEVVEKRGKAAKTIPLYQYDYGQKLLITGVELPEYYEVHFSNTMNGEATTVLGDSTGVLIPDSLVATGEPIYLWLYLHDTSYDGETEYYGVIPVIKRAQPTDITPTPEEQSIITQVIAALNNMEDDMSAQVQEATDAKDAAEAAQSSVEENATIASDAADAALAAQTSTEAAQTAAEAAQSAAETAATNAGYAYNNADTARAYAVTAKEAAEAAQTAAESASSSAVSANENAQSAASSAEDYKDAALAAQGAAETAQGLAETAQAGAEDAENGAEAQALVSEGYALGTQDGVSVEAGSTYYHNNAAYFADQAGDAQTSAEAAQTAAEAAQNAAETAAGHYPKIDGTSKNWLVWDTTESEYVDTDICSEGKDGQDGTDGTTPVRGTDYWTDADKSEIVSDVVGSVVDDTAGVGDTNVTWSANKLSNEFEDVALTLSTLEGDVSDAMNAIQGVDESVDDILDHETYNADGTAEYTPVTENTTVSGAYVSINGYGNAAFATPSGSSVKIYPVESGKTYKVKGKCSTSRPIVVVTDSVVTSGAIATSGNFDYAYGTNSSSTIEEQEYTALRTGYLYLTYETNCGLWLKSIPQVRKYHMDDVLNDIADIDSIIDKIAKTKVDSETAWTKVVPRNAEPVAKVTNLANTVTAVRSILSRNVADKNAVTDVEVSTDHTMKKGIKTVMLPAGRYYLILGNVGAYTMVKRYENGVYSDTMYKEQFPMKVGITDPAGGCFIVYASSVANLGDLSGLCIIKLHDDEKTATFEAYSEKLYTAENLASDNRIDVVPNGILEFVNSGNTAVASTVEYTVFGKDDDTTTRKDFITSPDGTKFLPMIKNDGSVVGARVVPKKAFFIGNSLTSGWQTFGEAATESDKDFVARFGDVVSDLDSDYTFSRKWSTNFEQQTSLANAQEWVTTNIDPLLSSDLDLIVVQLSENVVSNESAVATFPESSLWLLQHLRTECPKARVIWMGVWFDRGWVKTLLDNTANTGCEYVDIRPLYLPENVSVLGTVYEMESDYTKEYTVDSFTVDNGQITLVFTVDGVQYTATIPSYTSYTSSSDTSITVTGIYHVVSTYYASIHPGDEGFRKIANKLLFDLGISDSEETIPADE